MERNYKRFCCLLLALVMVIGLMPMNAMAAEAIDVEVFVDREETVVLDGAVTPNIEGVKDFAEVTYETKSMAKTAVDNTFSADFIVLADCEYTFDKQDDGTWLISAVVDGTTVYIDPHAGAGNSGYPNRTHQSAITLEPSSNGAIKFHQMNEGYLHFWHNDDSKLYWDQCTNDGAGHDMLIYRQAGENEQSSTEVPGYVQVTDIENIADGGNYLIVSKANSGGYYAMRPCKTTSNKYEHICKIYGYVTELTITGTAVGSGQIAAGETAINVNVVAPESTVITLDYNYEGAPENGSVTAISGDPIGELPVPMRDGYTFWGWMLNGSKITSSYVVTDSVTLTADWITVPTKEKPANGIKTNGQPFPEGILYRIPGIVALADGTVVAMADSRWTTTGDAGGLDTIVSTSKDNGKTWEYTYANYLGDNGDVYNVYSTCFIDPAIATDGDTIYMIADLFPAGFSIMSWSYGSQAGSNGFNADGKLMLRDLVGDTYKHGVDGEKDAYVNMAASRSYDFYLDPNADGSYTIRKESDDSPVTGYAVDAMLNITSADGSVNTHLFKADSPYQVYPTNYLYLTTSTDGMNWSTPTLIPAKNATERAFLIGPGTGTYDSVHENVVFTAYSYPDQKACLLWAGKDGVWHRSEPATTNVWSSEASAVVLSDGTVRLFYRSASTTLCYTDYLWVDGEYVRDVNNTSVATAAVKNGGNGCMLSSVMYPELVNGKELILVATPATTNSRTNGYIYAFNVNDDGSMELIASHDITPGTDEYYAYSCLTVLTEGNKAGDLGLFWENAAAGVHYTVVDIHDVLQQYDEKDVELTVGSTVVLTDDEGYYVGADTSALNSNVATVEITGTVTESALAAKDAVSAIESGEQYIIVNTRAGKPMSNATASSAAAAGAGSGLSLTGIKNNVTESAVWTIEVVNGGYKVMDANGKYLTVTSNGASVTDTESIVTIARNGNTWTISQNGAYLNDFGGGGTCAAGWQNASAAGDAGSQWDIYTVGEIVVEGTSQITFTGVAAGETSVQIGHTIYNITVTASAHVHTPAEAVVENKVDATCTEDGSYDSVVYCTECKEEVSRVTVPVAAPGHTHVNGKCACGDELKSRFEDVLAGSYYFDPVEWAVENGITTGTTPTTFTPNSSCQRAAVVTLLWRAAGFPEPTATECPFNDVAENAYYYKAVLWAVEMGITKGTSENEFSPFKDCTRAQVVTFLWRAQNSPESTAEASFEDVLAGQFYTDAVAWAVENGITKGLDDTTFGVNATCNRAQVVTFLFRAQAE